MPFTITTNIRFYLVLALACALSLSAAAFMPSVSYAQDTNAFVVLDEEEDQDAVAPVQEEEEAATPKASTAPSDPDLAAKFEVAKKIIEINMVERELNAAINNIAEKVPANRRILFKSIIDRSIKIDRLNAAAQLAFVEVFTLDELNAMEAYYSSEEGKAIQDKMPEFDAKIAPVIQSMLEDAVYNIKNSNVDFSK